VSLLCREYQVKSAESCSDINLAGMNEMFMKVSKGNLSHCRGSLYYGVDEFEAAKAPSFNKEQ
jgi:hypothetical protein